MVRKGIFSIEVDNYALEGRTLQIGAFPALPEASLDRIHICGWGRIKKNMGWKVSNLLLEGFSMVEVRKTP